jgi:hypothetical protein
MRHSEINELLKTAPPKSIYRLGYLSALARHDGTRLADLSTDLISAAVNCRRDQEIRTLYRKAPKLNHSCAAD